MGLFSKSDVEENARLVEEQPDPFETLLSQPVPQPVGTVVAQGMTLTGALKGEGDIVIEGKLVGEIETTGAVNVTSTGEVEGPIKVENARVAGNVKGNITARSQLRLECTGSVEGDVSAASLIVENGSSFNGRSTMLQPAEPAKKSEPKNNKDIGDKQDKY